MRLRTGYSFRTAFGHLAEVAEANPWSFAPITDRASTFGFARWTKLAKEAEKHPVYGVELAVTPSINEKKPVRSHMTFMARRSLGSINRLVEKATAQFRYEPLLTYEDVNSIDTDEVLILTGRRPVTDLLDIRPGVMFDLCPSTPPALLQWARTAGLPVIASLDNFYPTPEDFQAYEVTIGRGANSQSYPQHILSRDEWLAIWKDEEAWARTENLAAGFTAELRQATLLAPERPMTLMELCCEGARQLGVDLTNQVYSDRLKREIEVIALKEFEDYFYIIADLCQYARKHMFVGPARGSSCGSLVCYLLGITTVDPIPHGLLFERFIDITRMDLPDIDIDFSDSRRYMVFEYLEEKYGRQRVARLGTVALYKPRSAIGEAGAALRVPKWRVDQFTGTIIERSGGDARALQGVEDTFAETETGRKLLSDFPELAVAMRMEGHPRHHSQHAAGVVVLAEPVTEYVAVDARTGATHCDKKDSEALNLLKIDALGLIQLSIFEDCLEMIGKSREWLINYPLDDTDAFAILNDRKWSAVFQWNGNALQSLTQQTVVGDFEDIISITALARPGPLNSGGANRWIARKNGQEAVDYPHDAFIPALETSLGIVIYQEQVMQIGQDIGGLDRKGVTFLRKAMSSSAGKETFDKLGETFKKGALDKHGIPKEVLDRVWDELCQYGSWAFNRSHAVAYGMVSYWCCVLKAHHPLQYAAAALSHEKDPDKQLKMLREMALEGIEYIAVDPKYSTDKWQVRQGKLIGPLSNVKGLGPKIINQIIGARQHSLPMPARAAKLLAEPITKIDDLFPVATRIKELVPDLQEAGIVTTPTPLVKIVADGRDQNHVVLVRIEGIKPRDHNETQTIVKRGYKMDGPTAYLNLVLEDDTDRMLARVSRYDYDKLARPIIERGAAGKALYVMKGRVRGDFRQLEVKRAKFLGMMNE